MNYFNKYLKYKTKYLEMQNAQSRISEERSYDLQNLERLERYINKIWKYYFNHLNQKSANHPFLEDLNYVMKISRQDKVYRPVIIKKAAKKISFQMNELFHTKKCFFVPKEILPKKVVQELFHELKQTNRLLSWKNLEPRLADLSNYLLYSNVDIPSYLKKIQNKGKDEINVLILGAGPTGLYIANYLHHIRLISPRTNLLVIDSRVSMKYYRLPYTRNRSFAAHFILFSSFFPEYRCLLELLGGIEIKYLENILIILAYGFQIPMYFTNKIRNETSLKKFILQNKFDVVFDCTGNRLKHHFIQNIPPNFFKHNTIFENNHYQITIQDNDVSLSWKKHIRSRFFLSAEVYAINNRFVNMPIFAHEIHFLDDIKLLSRFHNKCIRIKKDKSQEVDKIFDGLKDLQLSREIKMIFWNFSDFYVKFFIIEPKLYHKIKISDIIEQKDQRTLYIGAGDTIFSSHFILGAGLNRMLYFINYVVWSMQSLSM